MSGYKDLAFFPISASFQKADKSLLFILLTTSYEGPSLFGIVHRVLLSINQTAGIY